MNAASVRPAASVLSVRLGRVRLQQIEGINADLVGDALQALEGEVAFATFDAAHVGAVVTEDVGEGFLAEATGLAVGPEVAAQGALQVSLHGCNITKCYLTVYRLMSSVGGPVSRPRRQRPGRPARATRTSRGRTRLIAGPGTIGVRRGHRRTRMAVMLGLGAFVMVALEGCGQDRSAAAVCKVWDRDGLALHDRLASVDASKDLGGALAEIAGSPGRLADLMDRLAAVAPKDVEPAFAGLGAALRKSSDNAGAGAGNPLGALAGGLALAISSQGDVETVNGFLAQHCGIPGQ